MHIYWKLQLMWNSQDRVFENRFGGTLARINKVTTFSQKKQLFVYKQHSKQFSILPLIYPSSTPNKTHYPRRGSPQSLGWVFDFSIISRVASPSKWFWQNIWAKENESNKNREILSEDKWGYLTMRWIVLLFLTLGESGKLRRTSRYLAKYDYLNGDLNSE